MSKNDGGPAFPLSSVSLGMSLRDYFAAKAMQALIAGDADYTSDADAGAPMESWGDFAAGAYQIADEMLKAREAA